MTKTYPGEPLDLVISLGHGTVTPAIHCRLRFDRALDRERLVAAIDRTALAVPRLLCRYDEEKNRFVQAGWSTADALGAEAVDARRGPLLAVRPHPGGLGVDVEIGHVLTDGAGFVQYLYLLAACYGDPLAPVPENLRVLTRLPNRPPWLGRRDRCPPLPMGGGGGEARIIATKIPSDSFSGLRRGAGARGATVNDDLLAAYGRALTDLTGTDRVILPCPADLRRLLRYGDALRVANLTGTYFCPVHRAETMDRTLAGSTGGWTGQSGKNSACAAYPYWPWGRDFCPRPVSKRASPASTVCRRCPTPTWAPWRRTG